MKHSKLSIAYIDGDSHYGSTVTFFQGCDRDKIIEKIVDKGMDYHLSLLKLLKTGT